MDTDGGARSDWPEDVHQATLAVELAEVRPPGVFNDPPTASVETLGARVEIGVDADDNVVTTYELDGADPRLRDPEGTVGVLVRLRLPGGEVIPLLAERIHVGSAPAADPAPRRASVRSIQQQHRRRRQAPQAE